MYEELLSKLNSTVDASLSEVAKDIQNLNFTDQVLEAVSNSGDFISFFETINTVQRSVARPPVSLVIVLTKISQLPLYRTTKYI